MIDLNHARMSVVQLLAIGMILTGIATCLAEVHYVDPNNANPKPPYTNWNTAARVIQDALDAAKSGDEVLVTNGIYATGGRAVGTDLLANRVALDKAVSLRSLNGPLVTVIQGYQLPITTNGIGAIRCVYLTNGASLSGFTLTHGATLSVDDTQTSIDLCGGGVWCESIGDVVSDCVLVDNSAYVGGGAYGGTLNRCTLRGNSAASDWGGAGGGAAYSTLNNCTLRGNSAGRGGGAVGGTLNNCLLTDNLALWGGGAFGAQGGHDDRCRLNNCTLTRNSAQSGGGTYSYVDVANEDDFCTSNNCIVYFNTAPDGDNYYGGLLNYCCTTPLPRLGSGNITSDPQLASPSHLSTASPCRRAGSADYAIGTDIDGEVWASPPSIGCDECQPGAITGPLDVSIAAAFTNVATGFAIGFTPLITGRTTESVWDFGAGLTLTNQPYPSHAWTVPGDYAVVLLAYNESQPTGIGATVTVHVVTPPVHYVDSGSTHPMTPYLSWATAATSIQDAVDAFDPESVPGALVLVTNGTYASGSRAVYGSASYRYGSSDVGMMRNRVVLDKPVTLQSVNGPLLTVIQGYQVPVTTNGVGAIRCVYMTNGASLSGFTLTQGATVLGASGGGVWCEGSTAIVSNCLLVGNSAGSGGGARYGTLNNCTIISNSAAYEGGGACSGTLNNCKLNANYASFGGGVAGGILNQCILSGNSTAQYGAGAYLATLNNCALNGNSASFLGGGAYGGTLNNCTMVGNSASWGGGTYGGSVNNCIIYFNTDPFGGNYDGPGDQGNLNYCCTIPQPASGIGNITNAPLFVDLAGANLRLQSGSPCINAGRQTSLVGSTDLDGNPRIVGGTVDIGAYEFQTPASVISYAWLQQYGLPTDGSADYADPDEDGMNNWLEWRAGTEPTNALSVLQMLPPTRSPSGLAVRWQSVNGRNYFLERGTNLGAQPPFSTLATNIIGQAGTTVFTDTNAVGAGPFFYRVGVQE